MKVDNLLKKFNITYDELLEYVVYQNCEMMIVAICGNMFKIYENKQVKWVGLYDEILG